MLHWSDVLVIGGGPGGSTVARRLAQAGLQVTLLDRRSFPRDKTCAGWVTPAVVETLGLDLDDYAERYVLQPITGFRSGILGGEAVETRYEQIVSYGIRRCEFDTYLLDRSGAHCQLGEAVRQIERGPGGWRINERWAAPLLIGAGGHFCPVARQLGARLDPAASVVTAQEIEFEVPPDQRHQIHVDGCTPELFFCGDLAGYGWCFRKGNHLNLGLGRTEPAGLTAHREAFCELLRTRGKVNVEIKGRFHGHAYQLYERTLPKLFDEGVMLVGDAAGLAYPQSGEGIRPAVESGVLAAEVALAASGRYERDALQPYAERVQGRFGTPRSTALSGWIPAAWLQTLAGRLMASRWFARRVIFDRWFLHHQQPAMKETPTSLPAGVS